MATARDRPAPADARPRALITGASSGIGAAFAERLAREGYDLVLVARRRDRLDALARRLAAEAGADIQAVAADLTDAAALRALEARAAADERLALLINNAGFAAYRPFLELDADVAEAQIRLHLTALVRLTRAALPGMVRRGRGAVVNLSSGLAFSAGLAGPTLPPRAVYAATKAFINAFSEIVAEELRDTGVRVQTLCPGPVRTEFFEGTGIDLDRFPPGVVMEPAAVVEASLAGLARGEVLCVPALEDDALVAQSRAAQHEVLAHMRGAALASRYRPAGPP